MQSKFFFGFNRGAPEKRRRHDDLRNITVLPASPLKLPVEIINVRIFFHHFWTILYKIDYAGPPPAF